MGGAEGPGGGEAKGTAGGRGWMGSGKEREWREREWGGREGGAEGRDVAVGIYLPPSGYRLPLCDDIRPLGVEKSRQLV